MVFYRACGARGFLSPVLPAAARFLCASILVWCSQLRICLTAVVHCVFYLGFSPPQVAKVPGIAGWEPLHHGAYVGVVCNNNGEVSGVPFTDIALWMSATSPADVTLV